MVSELRKATKSAGCSLIFGARGSVTISVDDPVIWAPYDLSDSGGPSITSSLANAPFAVSRIGVSATTLSFEMPVYKGISKIVLPEISVNIFLWALADSVDQIKMRCSKKQSNSVVLFGFGSGDWAEISESGSVFDWPAQLT